MLGKTAERVMAMINTDDIVDRTEVMKYSTEFEPKYETRKILRGYHLHLIFSYKEGRGLKLQSGSKRGESIALVVRRVRKAP